MSKLQETLDKIATIAIGNNAEVLAEVEAVKATALELANTIAANEAGDEITKTAIADLSTAFDALVDKLAAAPAPVEPTPADTVVS